MYLKNIPTTIIQLVINNRVTCLALSYVFRFQEHVSSIIYLRSVIETHFRGERYRISFPWKGLNLDDIFN